MTKYEVKNMEELSGDALQLRIKEWTESRECITISFMNIWSDGNHHYAAILYVKNIFNL